MGQCKQCKYCYPMKTDGRKVKNNRYVCIYQSEAYTHPPFDTPTIPDPYVCDCKHFEERKEKIDGKSVQNSSG